MGTLNRREADVRLFHGLWSSVIAKLLIFIVATTAVLSALADPVSSVFTAVSKDSILGTLVIMTLAGCAFVVLCDVVVNDVLSERIQFSFGKRHRRWVYLLTAALLTMIGYASSVNSVFRIGSTWLYFGSSLCTYALGYLDAIAVGRVRSLPGPRHY